jgi:CO dehydrogenase maturation factor
MGRQEGPGCYCYLNNILRRFLDTLAADYRYVVVDNEAGMEHLSRRTTRKVDLMLVVADHSVKGARAARRIEELADELELSIGHRALLLNRVSDGVAPEVRAEVERSQLELLAELPPDEGIAAADAKGQPLVELPADNPFIQALDEALQRVLAKI